MPQTLQLCQNGGLLFLSSIGKQRKVGWVGDNSHVVMQQPVILMPKFRGEVFTHFQAVAVKYHSSKRN
jgi:hypothetical protein